MSANKNSRIVSEEFSGQLVTKTARRDEGTTLVKMSTDLAKNASELVVKLQGTFGTQEIVLNGRQARTLFMTLERHYANRSDMTSSDVSFGWDDNY